MLWLTIALLSYFLLAVVSLGDKYLLSGDPKPKTYSFYVGLLGILTFLLVPFVDFAIPSIKEILISFLSGFFSIIALFFLFSALKKFEASRIIPAIGGLVPIFTFFLLFLFSGALLEVKDTLAFLLLVLGSVVITYKKKTSFSKSSLLFASLSALFFALHFSLSKYIYLEQPFWSAFIVMRGGAFLTSLAFLLSKEVREEVFTKQSSFSRKTGLFFLLNQGAGALAFILQHFSIYLAGVSYVSIIMALQGSQYGFLFILSIFLSYNLPWAIKEEAEKTTILQKSFAILLIIIGLIFLNIDV